MRPRKFNDDHHTIAVGTTKIFDVGIHLCYRVPADYVRSHAGIHVMHVFTVIMMTYPFVYSYVCTMYATYLPT